MARRPPAPVSARQRKRPSRVAPATRLRGLELLVAGEKPSAIAAALGVNVSTVTRWAEEPECVERLAQAAAARTKQQAEDDAARAAGAGQARKEIVAETVFAARVLRDALTHRRAFVRIRAAAQILDRGGVVRTERVETGDAEFNLEGLTGDELREALAAIETLDRLTAGRRKGSP